MDRRRSGGKPGTVSAENFRPAESRIRFYHSSSPGARLRALHPALEHGRELGEIVDRRIRLDVHRLLRRSGKWPAPDRAHTQALGAPYVLHHPVSHHDRVARRNSGKLERTLKDRLVWLLPPHTVRAGHYVDRVGQPEALPVGPNLVVAARERVRDEANDQATVLAPAQRLRGSRHERADEVQRKRGGHAKVIDLDVVDADLAVAEPVRIPAVRLLPQVVLGVVPMIGGDLRLEEGVVPGALTKPPAQRIERQRPYLRLWLAMLNERVAHVVQNGTKRHAAIGSAPRVGC